LFLWEIAVVQPFSPLSFSNCFIQLFIFWLYSAPSFSANIFIERRVLAQSSKVHLFQSKVCKEQAKFKKQKQSQELVSCHPRALRMPLYKERKKLFITIIIHHHHFTFTPFSPPINSPPLLSSEVGMTMQKGHKRM
jgi:hypothetical protein